MEIVIPWLKTQSLSGFGCHRFGTPKCITSLRRRLYVFIHKKNCLQVLCCETRRFDAIAMTMRQRLGEWPQLELSAYSELSAYKLQHGWSTMKLSSLIPVACANAACAAYSGDIVQYWVDQSAILVNGTTIGGLPSPPSGCLNAIVQSAVYHVAVNSANETLAFQQLAVSHAAHDTLLWTFHGTRLYATIDAAFITVATPIGINGSSADAYRAREIGEAAATRVTVARANDGIHRYVAYTPLPAEPGNYRGRPGGPRIPDGPQAQDLRLFGGLDDVTKYRAPPPPTPESPSTLR